MSKDNFLVRGIVINPFDKTVRMVNGKFHQLREIYKTIGSFEMTTLHLAPGLMSLADDMGAYRKGQAWFKLGAFPYPLCGKHLLVGIDQEGGTQDVPFMSPYTIEEAVAWLVPLAAQLMFPPTTISGPDGTDMQVLPFTAFETLPMPDIEAAVPTPPGSV